MLYCFMVANGTIEANKAVITDRKTAEIIATLTAQIDELQFQLAWFKRQLFGAKSEKLIPADADSPSLPGFAPEPQPEPPAEAHERKAREKSDWNEIPADLPREEEIIDVPEAEREGMELIGYEVSERLARRDTRFFVKVIKRAKYADKTNALRGVVTAPAAGDVLDSVSGRTKFDVSFISGVVSDKIENHLPLYRQAEIMGREGLPINRSALCHLFGGTAEQLSMLYERMDALIMACDIIHADETTTKLLEPGRKKCKTAYVWGRMSGIGPPLIAFHFEKSRSKKTAKELYGDYFGTIIRDAYVGYEDLEAGFAACWAHVRRKLFDAWNAGYLEADTGLKIIRQLYRIETEAKARAEKKGTETALFQERKTARRASASLVGDFFEFCRQQRYKEIPSSPLRKAVNYALTLENELSEFLKNPKLNIDNNPMENMIRPIALGRKNWLFAGSEGGGKHLAILQSFAATCKANKVNFRTWLEDILLRLGTTPAADIDTLLPHLWQPVP